MDVLAQEIFRVYGTVAIREDGDIEQRMNDIGNSADDSGDKFNDLIGVFDEVGGAAGGLAAILGGALIAILKESVDFADEFADSLGNLKGDTEATTSEMQSFEKSLENIYRKGYGDSIADVGNAISDVHKQTGALNEELDKQVENTMVLADKMDADYGETIRTVDNLVKIFGMTHEEAFDLIAQGYQSNLNVGGDLLDLFNEYSVKLQQLGFDENDMLNILLEGQEKGIFNYDLLLDGIKEYQINVSELAQDTEGSKEFFEELGLKVEDVAAAYKAGGDEAREMSIKIWEALDAIEDPLEKNRIGVELYGTMWEDTGGKINEAALGIQKDIKDTKGSMDDLIETKSDSLAENWEKTKRDMELKTFKPIGKLLSGLLGDFLKWFNDANDAIYEGMDEMEKIMEDFDKKMLKQWKKFKAEALKVIDSWKDEFVEEFNEACDDVLGIIDWFVDQIVDAKKDINGMTDSIASGFDTVSEAIGNVINKISNIKFPSVPSWIPGFAEGVRNLSFDTLAVVGEKGPELVHLPKGANVYTNEESTAFMNQTRAAQATQFNGSQGNNIQIDRIIIDPQNISDMKDFIDIIMNFKNDMVAYGGGF